MLYDDLTPEQQEEANAIVNKLALLTGKTPERILCILESQAIAFGATQVPDLQAIQDSIMMYHDKQTAMCNELQSQHNNRAFIERKFGRNRW